MSATSQASATLSLGSLLKQQLHDDVTAYVTMNRGWLAILSDMRLLEDLRQSWYR